MSIEDMAIYMAERRKKRRDTLITLAGGKCVRCNSTDNLNFDHKDPVTCSFRLNGKMLDGSWAKILLELEKCQLLCRTCHIKKTREDGYGPAWNKGISTIDGSKLPEHGCEASYFNGCKCILCRKARYDARVKRGELKGTRGFRG